MAYPKTYTAWRRVAGDVPRTLEQVTEPLPEKLGPGAVLIRIHAVSLNFRDVGMLHGRYPSPFLPTGIAGSDCAAEVVAMGPDVADFAIGDHVAPIFELSEAYEAGAGGDWTTHALGGEDDGVLRDYAVFQAKELVHLPAHLSWEEASTLPCAGVTAWASLNLAAHKDPTKISALMQGTGGVSMCALLFCIAAGARPIITSSSDAKLDAVRKLHPSVCGINYKTTVDVVAEVLRLTGDRHGVDVVVNNVGPSSLIQDLAMLTPKNGSVAMVGFLAGLDADWKPSELLGYIYKRATLRGIHIGTKQDFIDLNAFITQHQVSLTPLVDRVFPFSEAKEAFDYLYAGKHVGKVVVKL